MELSYLQTKANAVYPWQEQWWQNLLKCYYNKRLPHAMLFQGDAGLGKLYFAKQFAMRLFCEVANGEMLACNRCRQCQLFLADGHPDCMTISPLEGASSIKIDQIRHLIEALHGSAQCSEKKVVIIEPAELMNKAAQNCLLKILEEPPAQIYIILVNHNSHLLLPTVKSRCQFIHFKPSYDLKTLQWLQSQVSTDVDPKLLLSLVHGRPLAAIPLAQNNEIEQQNELINDLVHLKEQNACPVLLAEKWMAKDIQKIIETMINFNVELIKYLVTGDISRVINKTLIPNITATAKLINIKAIFTHLDKLFQVRSIILTKANCNLQLLLEDLFIEWMM